MDVPRGIAALIVFAFGACIGSFVNVVAYRLPRDISIITPRSFCPNCNQPVPFWANVPVVAYLLLRARCNACGGRIAFRYFLTELALASAAAYLFLNFSLLDALARFVFCSALFVVALIDLERYEIPVMITFPGIPLGILAASLMMPEVGWQSSLAGIVLGAGFLFLTGALYLRLRHIEGVGLGDVWLLGMVGAFLGWPGALFTLFAGSVLGTLGAVAMGFSGEYPGLSHNPAPDAAVEVENPVTARSLRQILQTPIPFGPFLAIAAAIFALFQPALTDWYRR
jgi:leader peptidase (prepilin peptidase) / N-methyltransferase